MIPLITSDTSTREAVQRYAARAGAHLTHHTTITAEARRQAAHSPLVLLGADIITAMPRARLPRTAELVMLSHGPLGPQTAATAARVRASFVVDVRHGGGWLTDRLAATATGTLARLRAAGYRLGFADYDSAQRLGFVTAFEVTDRPQASTDAVYASFGQVAAGDCKAGQSTTAQRSNFRVLHRRFPDAFTDLVFSNVTVLGGFACDLSPQVVDQLCALADYPLLDEDDHSALEGDEITASWQQWAASDVYSLLDSAARDAFDTLTEPEREQLWWQVVTETGEDPQHTGYSVHWNYDRLIPPFTRRLTAAARRDTHDR